LSCTHAQVADVFLKSTAKASLPKAANRKELIDSLSSLDASDAANLMLEAETLEEDWLIALQAELTKGYFLNVGRLVTGGC